MHLFFLEELIKAIYKPSPCIYVPCCAFWRVSVVNTDEITGVEYSKLQLKFTLTKIKVCGVCNRM